MQICSGRWQTLSPGNLDESPSFAPQTVSVTVRPNESVEAALSGEGLLDLAAYTALIGGS